MGKMRRMRNRTILAVSAMLMFTALVAGCTTGAGKQSDTTVDTGITDLPVTVTANSTVQKSLTLEEIVEMLCKDIDIPPYEIIRLDQTNFEYYTFLPYDDSLSAVAGDALVNVTPHSLVVIYSENGIGDMIAREVLNKADPNKWISTGSEIVYVAYTEHYVVLVMSEKDIADAVVDNFREAAQEIDGMEMKFLSKNNARYE